MNDAMPDRDDQTDRTRRPAGQAPLLAGLLGVAVGAAIGAGTGMWWMMGVLGGALSGAGYVVAARAKS